MRGEFEPGRWEEKKRRGLPQKAKTVERGEKKEMGGGHFGLGGQGGREEGVAAGNLGLKKKGIRRGTCFVLWGKGSLEKN